MKLKRSLITLALVPVALIPLTACGQQNSKPEANNQNSVEPQKPANLVGAWKSTENEGSFFEAFIDAKTITVKIVSDAGKTKSLYWAGSYTAPKNAGEYSWDSKNDKAQTGSSILGSPDESKKFTYKDSKISFEMSVAGTTRTVELSK